MVSGVPGARQRREVERLLLTSGDELRRLRRGDGEGLEVEFKGPRDLVTAADRASEGRIVEGLARLFPGDAVLSEERRGAGSVSERIWIVDPLDGTTNYAHGHPLYAISVALWEGGEPLFGVVHAPALGQTWCAARGEGTLRDGARVRVDAEGRLDRVLLATGFSYSRAELDEGALEVFGRLLREAREIRRGGSACLDLAHTASGVFAGFWEYHLHPHDVAAGALLVREAGGRVTDVEGGEDWLLGGSIVAGSPPIHRRLLDALAEGPRHPGRGDGPR